MKIMVCYDGGDAAKEAMKVAKEHAKAFGASVEVVTALQKGLEDEVEKIQAAEKELEYAQSFFEDAGISCNKHLLIHGLTSGEDLAQFAQDHKVDQVFIGVKKRSKVGKLVFGSTAQFVILETDCPVVSVK
ncbi:MAG: universal stress protein [Deltaproteobacteria bacterium]|nr:universal stress protein [Deltaproteobacteria bacterium]